MFALTGYDPNTIHVGMRIKDTTVYFVVRDCGFDAKWEGIRLENVTEGTATIEKTLIINGKVGINITNSPSVEIRENICQNNAEVGIKIENSNAAIVRDNICIESGYGIEVNGSSCCEFTNNTCINSYYYGYRLKNSRECSMSNNTAQYCGGGIILENAQNCKISYSHLMNNTRYGLKIDSESENNLIYYNNFFGNSPSETSQAYDNGTNNIWFNEKKKKGNYWSDWNGKGVYYIDGSAKTSDMYPQNERLKTRRVKTVEIYVFILSGLIIYIYRRERMKKHKKRIQN